MKREVRRSLRLKGERADFKSIERRHPWFFTGAFVPSDLREAEEGEIVNVVTKSGEAVGTGYYERGGGIAVRMLTFGSLSGEIDASFFEEKIRAALGMRKALGYVGEERAYRLIYGEGDGLPGLIADIYSGLVVLQAHTVGMALRRDLIAEALKRVYGDRLRGIYYKSEGTLRLPGGGDFDAAHLSKDTLLYGTADGLGGYAFRENGVAFRPDIVKGQKTGFFLDQRENRLLVKRYAEGKRVLNMFCYTGGFSLLALSGGAASVTSVDSSRQALALLERNLALNPDLPKTHLAVAADAFEYLEEMPEGAFDLVVLDPPAFAKNRSALPGALQGYRKLNAAALRKMPPGSLLFTFSCSQVVTPELFGQALFTAALQAGRNIRILHRLTQAPDHPVSIYHPEGEYLKGLALYVE